MKNNIKKLRINLNLSQQSFADLLGIGQSMLSQIEIWRTTPNYKTRQKIKDKLSSLLNKPINLTDIFDLE